MARALLIRLALAATAVSLWVYIPYRYAVRPPPLEGVFGVTYAVLFPLAGVLALVAALAAFRPEWVERLRGSWAGSQACRRALGAYGAVWLVMGLMCLPALQALSADSHVQAGLATIHMTAQHVFLGLAAVAAAWRPDAVAAILRGRSRMEPAPETLSSFPGTAS